jgi:hypothetical protein
VATAPSETRPAAASPSISSSSSSKSSSAPARPARASSATAKKSVHPAPRRRAPAQKSEELPYDELWAKLPKSSGKTNELDEAELVSVFLRDELRSLLKRNGVSYHRPGPKNMMKSKTEMAEDLIALMRKDELRSPMRLAAEEKAGIAPMQLGSKSH